MTKNMYTLKNPIIPGFYPDPSVCEKNGEYFLVTSSFEYFPGVPVFKSRNLVDWEQIGHCLTTPEQLPLENAGASGGIYAPVIRYHGGTFYMVTTNVTAGGHFIVTAQDPAGEWSAPIWVRDAGGGVVGGIDPSLYFDGDGKVYFTFADYGIKQAEIDVKTGVVGEIKPVWSGIGGRCAEAPHLYKIDGRYYMMLAEGGTETGHMVTIARSDSPWGPFESCPHNPVLSNQHTYVVTHGTGHGDLIVGSDGKWWMVFHGFRHSVSYFHHLGRETYVVPVDWKDGWPVVKNYTNAPIGCGTVDEIMEIDRDVSDAKLPAVSPRSNFSHISHDWVHLRNPDVSKYAVEDGVLVLKSGGDLTISSPFGSPTMMLRRQTCFNMLAGTQIELTKGGEAGITVYYNFDHHYDFALTQKDDGKVYAIVRKTVGDIVMEAFCREYVSGAELFIRADKDKYYFMLDGEEVATGLTQYVSTEATICSFTGVLIGLYAQSDAVARFSFFEMKEI